MTTKAKDFLDKNNGKLTFARALKANRLAANYTQPQLADFSGVTKQAISQFENGRDFPSPETAKALAKALKMDWKMYFVLISRDILEKKGFIEVDVAIKKAKSA